MRKHLGDGFPLMADANMKWSVDDAIRAARALLRFDLEPKTSETHRSPT
jgi:L-alanine-DL-glutamate epimerase-like enolase superfamily enzyme